MSLDHLWAGWRSAYIDSITGAPDEPSTPAPRTEPDAAPASEAGPRPERMAVTAPPPGEGSLFERILTLPDAEAFVVHRGTSCSALLNAYPYTNGHVLVLPNRAVASLDALRDDEHSELWQVVRSTVAAVETAYRCDGVNVGMNLGHAAGAGVPDHLHVHVLPRWAGDSNFMTSVANTRVLPEPLDTSWRKLVAHWPS
jgi:ATP adenylyltransferase